MGRGGLRAAEAREHLIASGELFASSGRLTGLLGVTAAQLPAALRRSVERGDFVRVCRGGWIVRDDRTRASGRRLPDLRAYIDAMMRHLGHLYYVGFNAAAAMHGAAHRRFTNTVVATSSRTTHRSLAAGLPPDGSMTVTYLHSRQPHRRGFTRRRMPESLYPAGTFVDYSTAEVTLLDMVQRPDLAGGLDHVCTVAGDLVLADALDAGRLAAAACGYPQTVRQRCGHILNTAVEAAGFGASFDCGPLKETIPAAAAITPLMPDVERFFPPDTDSPAALAVDKTWQVRVNAPLDPDL